jgi:DNA-binding CsgD family transcriptional regulator
MKPLSPREREALRLIAAGRQAKEAAVDMRVSYHTMKDMRDRILVKLGATNAAHAVAIAARRGLLAP